MSKLGDMFVLGQQVSTTAKEEASRYDHPQIDVDHVLLALLVGGRPAGTLLREQGLTLETARRAAEQVRAGHIGRLGIVAPAAAPRPIRDPSIGEVDWAPRALKVVSSSGEPGDLALLAALLDEPSGLVAEVLATAEIDVTAVRAALAARIAAAAPPPDAIVAPAGEWRVVTHAGFVPAPVAEVWALLADPARRPDWDSTVGLVEVVGPDLWEVNTAPTRPDGKPVRSRPGYSRTHHRITAYAPQERIEWEITLPDLRSTRPGRHRVSVGLRPTSGGTALDLSMRWPRRTGWRGLRQLVLHPAHRAVAMLTLLNHASGLSRVLR